MVANGANLWNENDSGGIDGVKADIKQSGEQHVILIGVGKTWETNPIVDD